jgi:hypothetical protein
MAVRNSESKQHFTHLREKITAVTGTDHWAARHFA